MSIENSFFDSSMSAMRTAGPGLAVAGALAGFSGAVLYGRHLVRHISGQIEAQEQQQRAEARQSALRTAMWAIPLLAVSPLMCFAGAAILGFDLIYIQMAIGGSLLLGGLACLGAVVAAAFNLIAAYSHR